MSTPLNNNSLSRSPNIPPASSPKPERKDLTPAQELHRRIGDEFSVENYRKSVELKKKSESTNDKDSKSTKDKDMDTRVREYLSKLKEEKQS